MILAAVLLAACLWMPSFPPTIPPSQTDPALCTPSEQVVQCRCSECFAWEPVVGADSYQVRRRSPVGTYWTVTRRKYVYVDDGVTYTIPPPTVYCPAKHDESMPLVGNLYTYDVAACSDATSSCSGWSNEVAYETAPYAINAFRHPLQGN